MYLEDPEPNGEVEQDSMMDYRTLHENVEVCVFVCLSTYCYLYISYDHGFCKNYQGVRVEPSVEVFWYAAPLAAEASAGGSLKNVCVVGGSVLFQRQ